LGATFPLVHDGIAGVASLPFLQARFLLAAFALIPVVLMRSGIRSMFQARCIVPGALLAAGYLLQTEGLRTTSPSVSAFLTGASVVIVPVLGVLLRWETGSPARWGAVILALFGIFLLQETRLPDRWSAGESMTALCALAFAAQIVLVGRCARAAGDPVSFTCGQLVVAAFVLLASGVIRGEMLYSALFSREALIAAVFTGLLATALAFFVQTWAQRDVPAGVVAVCFAGEPLFAALVSAIFYGDRLSAIAWTGAALVTAAMLIAALESDGRRGNLPGDALSPGAWSVRFRV